LIVSSLCSCVTLAYSDNECAKQLLYALDDSVWGMKITTLEESTDFSTLDTEKLFSKVKYHELLVLVLVDMWLTSPTLLTHLLWSLTYLLWPQLPMSSTRASLTMRSPCW
jgi:hypothetical protein